MELGRAQLLGHRPEAYLGGSASRPLDPPVGSEVPRRPLLAAELPGNPPPIQRRPTDLAVAAVLNLAPGGGGAFKAFFAGSSPWAILQTKIREYTPLAATAIRARIAKLVEITDAVDAWKAHHKVGGKKPSANERAKLAAINALDILVMHEFAETDAATIQTTPDAQRDLKTWVDAGAANRPREGESVDDHVARFETSVEDAGRMLSILPRAGLRGSLHVLARAGAPDQLLAYAQAVPRTKQIAPYLVDFEAWLWARDKTLPTTDALAELATQHAVGSGAEIDTQIDAVALIKAAIGPQVGTGRKIEGHITQHDAALWPDVLADYLTGGENREEGGGYSREQALAKAATVPGYAEGAEVHLNRAAADRYIAVHEAMHVYQNDGFTNKVGWQVNEGATDYFARLVADQHRIVPQQAYTRPRGAVTKLVALVGQDVLAGAFFQGRGKALEVAVNTAKGEGTFSEWVDFMKLNDYASANALL